MIWAQRTSGANGPCRGDRDECNQKQSALLGFRHESFPLYRVRPRAMLVFIEDAGDLRFGTMELLLSVIMDEFNETHNEHSLGFITRHDLKGQVDEE
jgi:hypothetical protein